MLADLTIDGKPRKVLMHAPKNGFFYVIDRTNGQFISGNNYVPVTWAKGLDPKTGKPIENPDARYYKTGKPWIGMPGAGGAHSWHPMAFNPKRGLVYIPAQIAAFPYFPDPDWKPAKQGFNVGIDMAAGAMPPIPAVRAGAIAATKGALIAWDPVAQKERWRVDYPGPWNGGLLSTGGDLVFQGNAAGGFAAYSAADGKKLWNFEAQTGVIAAPITYTIGGEQYVAVMAGWGGVWSLAPGILSDISGRCATSAGCWCSRSAARRSSRRRRRTTRLRSIRRRAPPRPKRSRKGRSSTAASAAPATAIRRSPGASRPTCATRR
ncbi:MAG: PQQ-binding-like beta-propeller repeat protein [Sphingomonas sp.]